MTMPLPAAIVSTLVTIATVQRGTAVDASEVCSNVTVSVPADSPVSLFDGDYETVGAVIDRPLFTDISSERFTLSYVGVNWITENSYSTYYANPSDDDADPTDQDLDLSSSVVYDRKLTETCGSWVIAYRAKSDEPTFPLLAVQDCAMHPTDIDNDSPWEYYPCGLDDPSCDAQAHDQAEITCQVSTTTPPSLSPSPLVPSSTTPPPGITPTPVTVSPSGVGAVTTPQATIMPSTVGGDPTPMLATSAPLPSPTSIPVAGDAPTTTPSPSGNSSPIQDQPGGEDGSVASEQGNEGGESEGKDYTTAIILSVATVVGVAAFASYIVFNRRMKKKRAVLNAQI